MLSISPQGGAEQVAARRVELPPIEVASGRLFDFDFALSFDRVGLLCSYDFKHAFVKLGFDLALIDSIRQLQGALERAVTPLG